MRPLYCPGDTLSPGDEDLTKIYGTCTPELEDEVTPGWVWRDAEDNLLDSSIFNSSHLPACGNVSSVNRVERCLLYHILYFVIINHIWF